MVQASLLEEAILRLRSRGQAWRDNLPNGGNGWYRVWSWERTCVGVSVAGADRSGDSTRSHEAGELSRLPVFQGLVKGAGG